MSHVGLEADMSSSKNLVLCLGEHSQSNIRKRGGRGAQELGRQSTVEEMLCIDPAL